MSSEVFPVFPGLVFEDREPFYETETFASPSGYEQRVSNMATKRWRWHARGTLRQETPAPAPWTPYSELGALLWFLDRHKGSGESFLFDDPMARKNLLTYSQDFSQATWVKGGTSTVTADNTTAPDGTATADTINFPAVDDYVSENQPSADLLPGTTWVLSVWLKGTATQTVNISLQALGGTTEVFNVPITLTGAWQRVSSSGTFTISGHTNLFVAIAREAAQTATSVAAWGAQMEPGSSSKLYVPTGASAETGRFRVRFSDDTTPMRRVTDQWYAADFELVSVLGET